MKLAKPAMVSVADKVLIGVVLVVAHSRESHTVRTRNGLFLREAIIKRGLDRYAVPAALKRMMDKFRQKTPNYWSNEQYSEMFEFDGENDE